LRGGLCPCHRRGEAAAAQGGADAGCRPRDRRRGRVFGGGGRRAGRGRRAASLGRGGQGLMGISYKVVGLDSKAAGDLDLDETVFGLEVRPDILHRMVTWQLAKRRQGTHKTKGVSEISGTTKKPYRQKGTGRARHGSMRS